MNNRIKKIGKYFIKDKIAEGGMGVIFRAKHPTLQNDVILKKLTLNGNTSIVDRFKREAQLMLEFSNENIVKVYDHFREGSSYYIVMEYIDGISLEALIEKNRYLSNDIALLIFHETCKALQYAHSKGVIHRDIKPANVLISKKGAVKLTDFGIARSKNYDEEGLTCAGMRLGTPTYMSPEQIDDSSKVDKRSDIYSMGVMLYVMVTGKSPFPPNLVPQTINSIQKGRYVKPEKLNPGINSVIGRIIKKAMHCKINRRFDSVEKMLKISGRKLNKFRAPEESNAAIMEYAYKIKPKKAGEQRGNILPGIIKGLAAVFLAILLGAGILFYLYLNGYHYEYLYPEKFGAVKFTFTSHSNDSRFPGQYKEIKIFKLARGRYKEDKSIKLSFKTIEEKKYIMIKSDRLYLRSGRYRVVAYFGNQVFQKDFFLNPGTIQKEKSAAGALEIEIFNREITNLPVKMSYSVRDNGRDITGRSRLYISIRGKWTLWEDYIKSDTAFVSGKSYYFKAMCDNYYPGYASVYVEPWQVFLDLQIEMSPVPAYIYLVSSSSEYRISINNSEYYNDKNSGTAQKYSIVPNRFSKYAFSPGKYSLMAEMDEKSKKTIEVDLAPGQAVVIKIEVNKTSGSIKFFKKAGRRYVNID